MDFGHKSESDDWLAKWIHQIRDKNTLELGCAEGKDTDVLCSATVHLTCSDVEIERLRRNKGHRPDVGYCCVDHSRPLPFNSDHFDVVIAGLCLHYFSWETSIEIVSELQRVMKVGGVLIGRLNSVNDKEHGAGRGQRLEEGLYRVTTGDRIQTKRFFEEHDVHRLLVGWQVECLKETHFPYYGAEKVAWEFCAENRR